MPRPRVTLCLPGVRLLDEVHLSDRSREFPALATLFGRATWRTVNVEPADWLCRVHGTTVEAFANITASVDLADKGPWMRCDPVHMHADPNNVLLFGPQTLAISPTEADGLLDALRRAWPEYRWERGNDPTRWYVSPPPVLDFTAPSLYAMQGRSISHWMPTGAQARKWRSFMNEVQMVLHAEPLNDAREARGERRINALWLFGGEAVTSLPARAATFAGNDVLFAGLARACGADWRCALPTFPIERDLSLIAGQAFGSADNSQPIIQLAELDTQWLAPLLRALRLRRLAFVEITTAEHLGTVTWLNSLAPKPRPRGFQAL